MRKLGLRLDLIILIVFSNLAIPSSAKNSHCTGIITLSLAVSALMVIKPSGVDYENMTADDMVVVSLATGEKV